MFPVFITTNYNKLLSTADELNRPVYDLTDSSPGLWAAPPRHPAIIHLHGIWDATDPGDEESRIFSGVGLDASTGRCLVLSEHQYYRLYNKRDRFKSLVADLFGEHTLLLFLGASLSSDEAGVHAALTERILSGGNFAGLYVGLDLDPLRKRLLETRGVHAVNLRRSWGFSRAATETLYQALLDVCEARFIETPGRVAGAPRRHRGPEVLCVGISALSRVLSLGSIRRPGTETAYTIDAGHVAEEAGGQHFYPALHLVDRGHRVAVATAIGDDESGDRIIRDARDRIEKTQGHSNGDLITYYITRAGSTRVSTAITFGHTRLIFDYDGHSGMPNDLEQPFDAWPSLRALYLGGRQFLGTQEKALDGLENNVKLRFFETGTTGPADQVEWDRVRRIAQRCTHVMASSAFLLKLVGEVRLEDRLNLTNCQRRVARDYRRLLRRGYKALWSRPQHGHVLVVVMGGNGSAIAESEAGHVAVRWVRPGRVNRRLARNWLGCGDLFRGELIHQVLANPRVSMLAAAEAASDAVARKIERMSFLPG